ncbi:uncharacterized protein LOC128260993 isoform X2 [Drosophila gunungcola]|uniref:uncharacterized protein LOC128260993 isoform X2 n=1 Tax=Drosophila gunungcola TaxID=103775 RepID=UPI0022DF1F93|nr:uncharacterized protein LOC128260993 isoform X2 [Drosophila gunungcola]
MAPPAGRSKWSSAAGKTGADRNAAIADNVNKLIRKLSGRKASEVELRRNEQRAWQLIRKYRHWSTICSEAGRTLDSLVRRFQVKPNTVGTAVRELATKLLALPEQLEEPGQPDAEESLLNFLLSMTNVPVQNIRRHRELMKEFRLSLVAAIEESERLVQEQKAAAAAAAAHNQQLPNAAETEVDWVALFSEDFLEPTEQDSSDSLSDWSDDSDQETSSTLRPGENVGTSLELPHMASLYEHAMHATVAVPSESGCASYLPSVSAEHGIRRPFFRITLPHQLALGNPSAHLRVSRLPQLEALQPPAAATEYQVSERDSDVLPRTIHAHWWRRDIEVNVLPPDADPLANFAVSHAQVVNRDRRARGLAERPLPSTTTEPCLMREILLMFVAPANCCFFDFNELTRRINARPNVSICTVTAHTMQQFLQINVVPALEDMMELRRIISAHTLHFDDSSTGTLECFAYCLRDLVRPICQLLVGFENIVYDDPETGTLLNFVFRFRKHFRQLRLFRNLAENVILEQGPPHLRSAYLLSRLSRHTGMQVPHQKLATALLLISLKRYCSIIDSWWRRATLEDRRNEFILERVDKEAGDTEQRGQVRKRCVHPDEGAQAVEIFRELQSCPFYQLLLEHALESADTQDLLANVNLLGEMLATSYERQPLSLFDELAAQLFTQIEVYCGALPADEEDAGAGSQELAQKDLGEAADELLVQNAQDNIQNADLRAILTRPAQERLLERRRQRESKRPIEFVDIMRRLERTTWMALRDELPEALRTILRRRQCLANEYAMRAYRVELQLGENVRFLRHTMLLEAYYLQQSYYNALFTRIESGARWARRSVLDSGLLESLRPNYPQLAENLRIKVISKVSSDTDKFYEGVEALQLVYDMPVALQRILTERHMQHYNAVWRLMLKVKWAAWKLENLTFLRRPGRRPYAPLDLIGLMIRRLEILRFWLIYLIGSLHTHIMQAVDQQFELRIGLCKNIRQLSDLHDEYMSLLMTHCLLTGEFAAFRGTLEQLFNLIFVLDLEWTSCAYHLGDNDALSLDLSGDADSEAEGSNIGYPALHQVVEIETTYIRCHQTMAAILTDLVYKQDHGFLTALEGAVNGSVPH